MIARHAQLDVPALQTNKAVQVTLTVSPDFSAALSEWAGMNDLSDAAASARLTGYLSGEGFVIVPEEAQSQPVRPGEPTVIAWTIKPLPGARQPLKVQVGALLSGGADTLLLGTVESRGGLPSGTAGRIVGFFLLALIAGFLAWVYARSRRPAPVRARTPAAAPV